MGLHISVNFGGVAQPRPYMWQPVRVLPAYPIAFVQQPVIYRSPMLYPTYQVMDSPYYRQQSQFHSQFQTHRNPSLGEFAGGMGILAATTRYGLTGLFCSIAALAIGKTIHNNLTQDHHSTPHVASSAATRPAVAGPSVDMSTLAINGLDMDTASPAAPARDTVAMTAERRRSIDNGHGFG